LSFDSERFDNNGLHNLVNPSRLTAATTGTYIITAHVLWQANNSGTREVGILLNGTTYVASQMTKAGGLSTDHAQSVTTIYRLSAGDYVECTVAHDAGVAINVQAEGNRSPEFAMQFVSLA
jgi:hypothetical protein